MKTTLITLVLCLGALASSAAASKRDKGFADAFAIDKGDLCSTGHNRYFVLESSTPRPSA